MKYMHNDNPGFQEVRAIYKGDLDIQLKKHGFGKMVYLMENERYYNNLYFLSYEG